MFRFPFHCPSFGGLLRTTAASGSFCSLLPLLSTMRSVLMNHSKSRGAASLPSFVVWRQHLVLSSARAGRRKLSLSAPHRREPQSWFDLPTSGARRSLSLAAANAGTPPPSDGVSSISPSSSPSPSSSSDVLIVGGGAVGAALARWIGMRLPGWSVTLVEGGPGPQPPTREDAASAAAAGHESAPHPRSYALSPAALDVLGLTAGYPHRHPRLGYYDSMQIWESSQPATLCFDKSDVALEHLGAVAEDSVIVRHLWNDLRDTVPQCELRTHTRLSRLLGPLSPSSLVEVELIQDDGSGNSTNQTTHTHRTRLLVAADGAHSKVRQLAGLGQVSLDYGQTALTLTVQVEGSLRGRCFQRFLPTGPLALLPTFSDDYAIVVWSTTPDVIQEWKDHPGLIEHLNELFQQGPGTLQPLFPSVGGASTLAGPLTNLLYGAEKLLETIPYGLAMAAATSQPASFTVPPLLLQAASPTLSFPLHLRHAASYAAPRLVLVGDAAHTVHPFAGQGLNLGLQDVSSLGQALEDAHAAGMDPGIAVPSQYDGDRRTTVAATLAGLHTLQRLFALQPASAKHLKAIGMGAVQAVPTFRQVLAEIACFGGVGRSGGGRGG